MNARKSERIFTRNLDWYAHHAQDFIRHSAHLDLRELYQPFLEGLPASPQPAHILDFGCGPGRDALTFARLGYRLLALDPCATLLEHLKAQLSAEPKLQVEPRLGSLEALKPTDVFEGIWASASLLHFPRTELPQALLTLARHLRSGGLFYASFKQGDFEGLRQGRYFCDWKSKELAAVIHQIPELKLEREWQSPDLRPERRENWLNLYLRRV